MAWMWRLHTREFYPQRDLKKYPVMFLNKSHSYPPFSPLFMWCWIFNEAHGVYYGCNETFTPGTRGHIMLDIDGCALENGLPIPDKKEIEQRKKQNREWILKIFAPKWEQLWTQHKDELEGYYKKEQAFDFSNATVYDLYKLFNETMWVNRRMWEWHFYFMYGQFGAYWEFEDMCKDYVGIVETDSLWHDLIRGYDNYLFRMDRTMWDLRNRAIELKVEDIIQKTPAEETVEALKETEAGKRWLDEHYHDFMFVKGYGWRQPRMMEFINPLWWEDPAPLFKWLKQYLIFEGGADMMFPVDNIRPELEEKRKDAEQEVLRKAKANGYPDMEYFELMMRLTQRTSFYSEAHDWIDEIQCHAVNRYVFRKIGERLMQFGTFDDPDDIFFFVPDELGMFIAFPENYEVGDIAKERRQQWIQQTEYETRPPIESANPDLKPEDTLPYVLGPRDPVVTKITVGPFVQPRPDTGAIVFGNCGNVGIAEGIARRVIHTADIYSVKPGEILICPATHGSWSSVWPLVKAVVTDGGGSVSHACIVGREYDVPVVSNTGDGTYKIKTGDRVRVDSKEGLVFKLGD